MLTKKCDADKKVFSDWSGTIWVISKATSHWPEPRFVTPHLSYSWCDDSADEGTGIDGKV